MISTLTTLKLEVDLMSDNPNLSFTKRSVDMFMASMSFFERVIHGIKLLTKKSSMFSPQSLADFII